MNVAARTGMISLEGNGFGVFRIVMLNMNMIGILNQIKCLGDCDSEQQKP